MNERVNFLASPKLSPMWMQHVMMTCARVYPTPTILLLLSYSYYPTTTPSKNEQRRLSFFLSRDQDQLTSGSFGSE